MADIISESTADGWSAPDAVARPRIFVQLDARPGRLLAFLDQLVQQVAEIAELHLRSRSPRVSLSVSAQTLFTDAFQRPRFDHCAGRASCSASAFSPEALISAANSSTISNGVFVGSNGPIQVAVFSS